MTFSNSIGKKSNGLALLPTGTSSGNTGELRFRELLANGTNYVSMKAPDLLSSDLTYTLPDAYPVSNGQVLSSTTGGVMSWVTSGSSSSTGSNLIINPEMIISQRATSFTAPASNAYTLDRYKVTFSGAMVFNVAQDSDVPSVGTANYLFRNSLLATITTTDTSIASTDFAVLSQLVEGYNYATIAQRAFVFSFWVKSSITGTYCVSFRNSGNDRSYVAEYTVNSANTWEKKTISVTASPSAGTWDYVNGIGLNVSFALASGSNFQTTANTWNTGNFLSTSNQVNFTGTNGATFRVTGLKLEGGTSATDYVGRDFASELMLCQRYYEKSYALATTPGTANAPGYLTNYFQNVLGNGTAQVAHTHRFAVNKRADATVTIFAFLSGASGNVSNDAGNLAVNAVIGSQNGYLVGYIQANGRFADQHHFVAASEL